MLAEGCKRRGCAARGDESSTGEAGVEKLGEVTCAREPEALVPCFHVVVARAAFWGPATVSPRLITITRESDVTGKSLFSFFFFSFLFFASLFRPSQLPFHGLPSLASVQRIAPLCPGSSFLSFSSFSIVAIESVSFIITNSKILVGIRLEINNREYLSLLSPSICLSLSLSASSGWIVALKGGMKRSTESEQLLLDTVK